MASRVSSPRASPPTPPKAGYSVLGQVRTVSRDEIRQDAMQDPFLEVYRSEKRPLSPGSITNSPSREQTFIAISKLTGPDGQEQDLRSIAASISSLQDRVESQTKEIVAQAGILEEQSRQLKELEPMKEWFLRQNVELYWNRVGTPRGIAAFEILKEVHTMLTEFMQQHIRSTVDKLENNETSEEDSVDEGEGCSNNTGWKSQKARKTRAQAYIQGFSKGPFRSKKLRQGTYEDLLMYVVTKEDSGADVGESYTEALVAAEEGFFVEAAAAGFELHDVGFIRSKMVKFLSNERHRRNEACHPLAMKRSKKLKQEIVDDIEKACDTQDLGDLNEISPFIKFGCLLFRKHNHLSFANTDDDD